MLLRRIKEWAKSSSLLNFNTVKRDSWVLAQALRVPCESAVLDVGAGSCPYSQYFRHCDYKTADFKQLPPDQFRGRKGYGKIDYVCDVTHIPLPDGSLDVILCTEVLEHLIEPIELIRECGRLLKPGGELIITAPLGSGIHQAPYHFYGGYTPYWYNNILPRFGLENIQVAANGGFYKHYGQESIRFAQMSAPWRNTRSLTFRIILTPLWALSLIWFMFSCPALMNVMDYLDSDRHFTVGYHVLASKKRPN